MPRNKMAFLGFEKGDYTKVLDGVQHLATNLASKRAYVPPLEPENPLYYMAQREADRQELEESQHLHGL